MFFFKCFFSYVIQKFTLCKRNIYSEAISKFLYQLVEKIFKYFKFFPSK